MFRQRHGQVNRAGSRGMDRGTARRGRSAAVARERAGMRPVEHERPRRGRTTRAIVEVIDVDGHHARVLGRTGHGPRDRIGDRGRLGVPGLRVVGGDEATWHPRAPE
jgi:hypothetical protein